MPPQQNSQIDDILTEAFQSLNGEGWIGKEGDRWIVNFAGYGSTTGATEEEVTDSWDTFLEWVRIRLSNLNDPTRSAAHKLAQKYVLTNGFFWRD